MCFAAAAVNHEHKTGACERGGGGGGGDWYVGGSRNDARAEFYAFCALRGDEVHNPTEMIQAHTPLVVFEGRLTEMAGGATSLSEEAPRACCS